jgi:hypothetical protein
MWRQPSTQCTYLSFVQTSIFSPIFYFLRPNVLISYNWTIVSPRFGFCIGPWTGPDPTLAIKNYGHKFFFHYARKVQVNLIIILCTGAVYMRFKNLLFWRCSTQLKLLFYLAGSGSGPFELSDPDPVQYWRCSQHCLQLRIWISCNWTFVSLAVRYLYRISD